MCAARLPYRLKQVAQYGRSTSEAPIIPEDARALLSPPMLHQFRILSHADQQHLLNVYSWLKNHGADEDTLAAGLIHDVGKACAKCRITIVDRALHVMLNRIAPGTYQSYFAKMDSAPAYLRGLHRLANHPARGALAAEQAGYNERVISLIRHHESGGDGNDPGLKLLREADTKAGAC